jgi:hypothetical protein
METWDEHAEIMDAIRDRHIGRARALAKSHVDRVKQVAIAFLVSAATPKRGHAKSSRRSPRAFSLGVYPELVTFDSARHK